MMVVAILLIVFLAGMYCGAILRRCFEPGTEVYVLGKRVR